MSDFKGFHHAFIGLALMFVGFLFLIYGKKTNRNKNIAIFIISIGAVIFGDDVYQHCRQYADPSYRSPLHVLYANAIYKWHFIQALNAWFDKLFGR